MKSIIAVVGSLFLTGCVVTTHVVDAQPLYTPKADFLKNGNYYSPNKKGYTQYNSHYWIVEAVVVRKQFDDVVTVIQCTDGPAGATFGENCYEVDMRGIPRIGYKVFLKNSWSGAYIWKNFNHRPKVGDRVFID